MNNNLISYISKFSMNHAYIFKPSTESDMDRNKPGLSWVWENFCPNRL